MSQRRFGTFFGEPWPSGICDEGWQVDTPVGEPCQYCDEPIAPGDRGNFFAGMAGWFYPVHRECSLRMVIGGIGHLQDHDYWCTGPGRDTDGGLTYRQSALAVWERTLSGQEERHDGGQDHD